MPTWRKVLGFDKPPDSVNDAQNPWTLAAADASNARTGEVDGFSSAKRRQGSRRTWIWVRNIAVGLVLIAGINQVLIQPIHRWISPAKAQQSAVERVDHGAAGALAASFAIDYVSFASSTSAQRSAALTQWVNPDTFPDASLVGQWQGNAIVIADTPVVGQISDAGSSAAVVAVRFRIRSFILPAGASSPDSSAATSSSPPAAAYIPSVPAGYVAQPPVWMQLLVPVASNGSELVVSGTPIFSNDQTAPVIPPKTDEDNAASTALRTSAKKIMASYATSDLSYITSGNTQFHGLQSTVSLSDVSAVKVLQGSGKRYASITVQWTLSGTDLRISQTYALEVSAVSSAPTMTAIGLTEPTIRKK